MYTLHEHIQNLINKVHWQFDPKLMYYWDRKWIYLCKYASKDDIKQAKTTPWINIYYKQNGWYTRVSIHEGWSNRYIWSTVLTMQPRSENHMIYLVHYLNYAFQNVCTYKSMIYWVHKISDPQSSFLFSQSQLCIPEGRIIWDIWSRIEKLSNWVLTISLALFSMILLILSLTRPSTTLFPNQFNGPSPSNPMCRDSRLLTLTSIGKKLLWDKDWFLWWSWVYLNSLYIDDLVWDWNILVGMERRIAIYRWPFILEVKLNIVVLVILTISFWIISHL